MMHVLPEMVSTYRELYGKGAFPLPFLIAVLGFLLILFVDRVLFDAHIEVKLDDEGFLDSQEKLTDYNEGGSYENSM